MTRPRTSWLLLALLVLALESERLQAQAPEPGTAPITKGDPRLTPSPTGDPQPVTDPRVAPPLPTADPQLVPQTAVQPGTVLRQPVDRPITQMEYAPAGQPPTGVQVTGTQPRSVSLSWTAPAGAEGYWVYLAAPGDTTFYMAGSLVTETSSTVTGLLPATSYSFKVSAVYPHDAQLRAGLSGPVTASTAPAPVPTGLTASIVGRGVVSLSWDRLVGADGFRISRTDATALDIRPMNYAGGTTLATSAIDSVTVPGTHTYQIRSVYRAPGSSKPPLEVLSEPSQPVSVVIPASSRVRYCQSRWGAARCAPPEIHPVTLATGGLP